MQDGIKRPFLWGDCEQLVGNSERNFKERFFDRFNADPGQQLEYRDWLFLFLRLDCLARAAGPPLCLRRPKHHRNRVARDHPQAGQASTLYGWTVPHLRQVRVHALDTPVRLCSREVSAYGAALSGSLDACVFFGPLDGADLRHRSRDPPRAPRRVPEDASSSRVCIANDSRCGAIDITRTRTLSPSDR
jgi:hypothetical protein